LLVRGKINILVTGSNTCNSDADFSYIFKSIYRNHYTVQNVIAEGLNLCLKYPLYNHNLCIAQYICSLYCVFATLFPFNFAFFSLLIIVILFSIHIRRRHLYNRTSQCLANPNDQPNFSYEKYG
jgi:hypothetical protein